MHRRLLLGLDVGTTGTKAVLVDEAGNVIATATTEYPMATPRPLWAEQEPEDWWRAATTSMRGVLRGIDPRSVIGVGLTGQMHGLVLLDRHGVVLRPSILWNDQRAGSECAAMTERLGAARVLDLTGNPILPGFTAPKLAWVRENEPEIYRSVSRILLPKDYLRYRLTGAYQTDVSDASGTSLFDVRRRVWSEEMLAAFDVPLRWLPDCLESTVVGSRLTSDAARATGLIAGTPVIAGASDQAAGAVGNGIVQEGIISVTLGTSGVVFASSDCYRIAPRGQLHAFCHAIGDRWSLMGVVLSAAGSLRWFRDALGQSEIEAARKGGVDVYDYLTAEAAAIPPGSDGLIFLPYLTGERTPYADSDARGVFFGLTVRHRKGHFIRGVLEGVSFALRQSLDLMRGLGIPVSQIRLSGGGARSALWRQIVADIFQAEVALLNAKDGAPFGAALLAGVGTGVYPSVDEACAQTIRVIERVGPGPAAAPYADYYAIYQELYPTLAPHFARVSRIAQP